jgi:hypothetical protein
VKPASAPLLPDMLAVRNYAWSYRACGAPAGLDYYAGSDLPDVPVGTPPFRLAGHAGIIDSCWGWDAPDGGLDSSYRSKDGPGWRAAPACSRPPSFMASVAARCSASAVSWRPSPRGNRRRGAPTLAVDLPSSASALQPILISLRAMTLDDRVAYARIILRSRRVSFAQSQRDEREQSADDAVTRDHFISSCRSTGNPRGSTR